MPAIMDQIGPNHPPASLEGSVDSSTSAPPSALEDHTGTNAQETSRFLVTPFEFSERLGEIVSPDDIPEGRHPVVPLDDSSSTAGVPQLRGRELLEFLHTDPVEPREGLPSGAPSVSPPSIPLPSDPTPPPERQGWWESESNRRLRKTLEELVPLHKLDFERFEDDQRREQAQRVERERLGELGRNPPRLGWVKGGLKKMVEEMETEELKRWGVPESEAPPDNESSEPTFRERERKQHADKKIVKDFHRIAEKFFMNRRKWLELVRAVRNAEGEVEAGRLVDAMQIGPTEAYRYLVNKVFTFKKIRKFKYTDSTDKVVVEMVESGLNTAGGTVAYESLPSYLREIWSSSEFIDRFALESPMGLPSAPRAD